MGTIVQQKFGGTSPGSSVGVTLDSNVTAGNKLVALMACYSSVAITLTASGGGTWTTRANNQYQSCALAIAVCESATGGATTVTATSSGGSGQYLSVIILEVSGLEATAFDVAASNAGNSSGTYSTGTTGTPAQDDNFVVGMFAGSAAPSMSTPSGFTNISLLDDSSTYEPYSAFYRNITASATQSASISSATSTDWAGGIVVLKDSGGGGGGSGWRAAFAAQTNQSIG